MAFYRPDKVVQTPSIPHGYLVTFTGNMLRAHTPTDPAAINHVSPWFSENYASNPVPHPCLTMGALLVYY